MRTNWNLSVGKAVLVIIPFLFNLSANVNAQNCDPTTPSHTVDLTSSPNNTWVSPLIVRDGNCCGTTPPDKCLEFVIHLHEDAIAINFSIASGAVPPGALFYQIDCGPPIAVGEPICLDGPGPHNLTFCKPGNNSNTYAITSHSEPIIGPDITMNSACTDYIYANFYNVPSMVWTSVAPGNVGDYNYLLSCTLACDTTYITAPIDAPSYIDYQVCGFDIAGCNPDPICDTIRVYFIPPVEVQVSPSSFHLCADEPATLIQASASGGTPPYSYLWNDASTNSDILAGPGTWWVNVTDNSGCLIASDTAIVTQDALPVQAFAGNNQNICVQGTPSVQLNGTIQTATGGIWSGGLGNYSPSNTDLNAVYSPIQSELDQGFVELILTTTGTNGCTPHSDTTLINFHSFDAVIMETITDVSCNGLSDGGISLNVNGTFGPFQYLWNGGALGTDSFVANVPAGTYEVVITNSLGCDSTLYFIVNEPDVLDLALSYQVDNICFGLANGEALVFGTGGTPQYSFEWNTNPIQTESLAQSLAAGTYTCIITDANGCQDLLDVTITEPPALTLDFNSVEPNCYNASNGAISSIVDGGTPPYHYHWAHGASTSNLYNLSSDMYSLSVNDANGCPIADSIFLDQPTLVTATITPPSEVCPNDSVQLQVIANGGTGNYDYEWAPGSQTTDIITIYATQDQNYNCVITDNNGCATVVATSIHTIQMDPSEITATISNDYICLGDSASIQGEYTGDNENVWIAWDHCATCNPSVPTYESPDSSTSYTLSAFNECGQQITAVVDLTVLPLPVIALDPVMGEVCPGEPTLFYNNGDNSPSWQYLWDFGDGNISTQPNPSHAYYSSGLYPISLSITDNYGCTSHADNMSTVQVYPNAVAAFSVSSLSRSVLDATFHFTNNSSNANSFAWFFGDGTSSAVVHPSHTYAHHGSFIVTMIANNNYNCPDTARQQIEVKPSFELFVPNAFTPDNDQFNETFITKGYGILESDFTLLIYNRWGEIVFESHDMNVGWDGTYLFTGARAQDGVYIWTVEFRDITHKKHIRKGHLSLLK